MHPPNLLKKNIWVSHEELSSSIILCDVIFDGEAVEEIWKFEVDHPSEWRLMLTMVPLRGFSVSEVLPRQNKGLITKRAFPIPYAAVFVTFGGRKKYEPRPFKYLLVVKTIIPDLHPRPFHIGVPTPPVCRLLDVSFLMATSFTTLSQTGASECFRILLCYPMHLLFASDKKKITVHKFNHIQLPLSWPKLIFPIIISFYPECINDLGNNFVNPIPLYLSFISDERKTCPRMYRLSANYS